MNNRNFNIPELYNKIVLKTNPEISKLEITDVRIFDIRSIIITHAADDNNYFIMIDIHFVRDSSPVGDIKKYSEILNTCFKFSYPDIDFITFNVNRMIIPPRLTNKERFMELFH